MASAQQKFWKLVIDSRLLALDECQRLHGEFAQATKAAPEDATALARWLIAEGVLTKYQARVLLAGKPGPFRLGDFTIMDRAGAGEVKGIYEAVNRSTGERVLLLIVPMTAAVEPARLEALARKVQKAAATGLEQMKSTVEWQQQGSLAFAILAELSPSPVATPAADDDQTQAVEWAAELPTAGFQPRAPRRRRGWGPALLGWGVALGLIALVGGGWFVMNQNVESAAVVEPQNPIATDTPSEEPSTEEQAPAVDEGLAVGHSVDPASVELVADDGETLWASPTSGPPLKLDYLPAGAEAILVLRAADLAGSAAGSKMIEAIGPAGAGATETIEKITGCPLSEIEQLQIGFYPVESGPPKTAFVVRLMPAVTAEAWKKRWPDSKPAEHADHHYFQAADRAYYLPEAEQGRLIVIAAAPVIESVIDANSPPPTKEMQRLLADTDEQRHFTLVAEPFWILGAGQSILTGELARMVEPLRQFVGDGVQAVLASGYVENDLFLELRAYGQADKDPRKLAAHYRAEVTALPKRFEAYLATLEPSAYGKAVLARFPQMLEQLQQFTRSGAEHHEAVLRCYLPAVAGHNLLLATELALFEQPKAGGKGAGREKKPAGPAAALTKRISISFPRDTLENCIQMMSNEIGVEIVILGSDLQLDGITKNQSFGLDERDQPAGEILLKILKLANSDGKLVYVIKPPPAGGDSIIFITTRAAVAKRGDKLPAELEKK